MVPGPVAMGDRGENRVFGVQDEAVNCVSQDLYLLALPRLKVVYCCRERLAGVGMYVMARTYLSEEKPKKEAFGDTPGHWHAQVHLHCRLKPGSLNKKPFDCRLHHNAQ